MIDSFCSTFAQRNVTQHVFMPNDHDDKTMTQRLNLPRQDKWWLTLFVMMKKCCCVLYVSHGEFRDVVPMHFQWQRDRPEHPHLTRTRRRAAGLVQQQQQQQWRILLLPVLLCAAFLHAGLLPLLQKWRPPPAGQQVHHSSEFLLCILVFKSVVLQTFIYKASPQIIFSSRIDTLMTVKIR